MGYGVAVVVVVVIVVVVYIENVGFFDAKISKLRTGQVFLFEDLRPRPS